MVCNSFLMMIGVCLSSIQVNYGLQGKTIPDFFGALPSLMGIFLGMYLFELIAFCTSYDLHSHITVMLE